MRRNPLILVTNDDGINSVGLWAAVEALVPLGEVLVVAPSRQWSGAGRSMPHTVTGEFEQSTRDVAGRAITAYAVDASPALCVIHAMLEFVPRPPDVVVSGINYGENLSTEVTVSGTVGAALEAATFGIPALAVSQEMGLEAHMEGTPDQDYVPAQTFTRHFTRHLLERGLPYGVNVLNVNVPRGATQETPWRLTRLSLQRYFIPTPPRRDVEDGRLGYRVIDDPIQAERDSDIWGICVDGVVTVTPLSLDLTAAVDFSTFAEYLHREP